MKICDLCNRISDELKDVFLLNNECEKQDACLICFDNLIENNWLHFEYRYYPFKKLIKNNNICKKLIKSIIFWDNFPSFRQLGYAWEDITLNEACKKTEKDCKKITQIHINKVKKQLIAEISNDYTFELYFDYKKNPKEDNENYMRIRYYDPYIQWSGFEGESRTLSPHKIFIDYEIWGLLYKQESIKVLENLVKEKFDELAQKNEKYFDKIKSDEIYDYSQVIVGGNMFNDEVRKINEGIVKNFHISIKEIEHERLIIKS